MLQQDNEYILVVSHLVVLVQGYDHRILTYSIRPLTITVTAALVL